MCVESLARVDMVVRQFMRMGRVHVYILTTKQIMLSDNINQTFFFGRRSLLLYGALSDAYSATVIAGPDLVVEAVV